MLGGHSGAASTQLRHAGRSQPGAARRLPLTRRGCAAASVAIATCSVTQPCAVSRLRPARLEQTWLSAARRPRLADPVRTTASGAAIVRLPRTSFGTCGGRWPRSWTPGRARPRRRRQRHSAYATNIFRRQGRSSWRLCRRSCKSCRCCLFPGDRGRLIVLRSCGMSPSHSHPMEMDRRQPRRAPHMLLRCSQLPRRRAVSTRRVRAPAAASAGVGTGPALPRLPPRGLRRRLMQVQ